MRERSAQNKLRFYRVTKPSGKKTKEKQTEKNVISLHFSLYSRWAKISTTNNQNLYHLSAHINHIRDVAGIDYVGEYTLKWKVTKNGKVL